MATPLHRKTDQTPTLQPSCGSCAARSPCKLAPMSLLSAAKNLRSFVVRPRSSAALSRDSLTARPRQKSCHIRGFATDSRALTGRHRYSRWMCPTRPRRIPRPVYMFAYPRYTDTRRTIIAGQARPLNHGYRLCECPRLQSFPGPLGDREHGDAELGAAIGHQRDSLGRPLCHDRSGRQTRRLGRRAQPIATALARSRKGDGQGPIPLGRHRPTLHRDLPRPRPADPTRTSTWRPGRACSGPGCRQSARQTAGGRRRPKRRARRRHWRRAPWPRSPTWETASEPCRPASTPFKANKTFGVGPAATAYPFTFNSGCLHQPGMRSESGKFASRSGWTAISIVSLNG